MKITFRDRLRAWLFGEEKLAIARIAWQVDNLAKALAQSINHEANILAGISAMQAHSVGIGSSVSNLVYLAEKNDKARAAAEAHFDHAKAINHAEIIGQIQSTRVQALEQLSQLLGTQERILLLVEPVAQRGNRPTPAVPDWDHVQAQNLEQFKE